jgi:purine-binding chemotaxis protein CheW
LNATDAGRDAVAAGGDGHLVFRLSGAWAALEIGRVREVVDPAPLTPVPRMPAFLLGVMNLRGRVVTVVDLGMKMGLGPAGSGPDACILLATVRIGGESTWLGLPADAVREVVSLPPAAISPPPRLGLGLRSEMVRGVADWSGDFLLVLDIDRALADLGVEAPSPDGPEAEPDEAAGPVLDLSAS